MLLSYFISNEDNWVCEKSHAKYSFLFLMLIFYCKIVIFLFFLFLIFYCKIVLPNVSEFAEIMTCESMQEEATEEARLGCTVLAKFRL